MRARELMSTPVVTVSPETPVKEVAEKMAAHAVSGVPVVDPLGRLVGIVSESDVLARLAHEKTERGLMGLLDALAQSVGAVKKLEAQTAGI